jgi:hypothetical protein
MALLGLLGVPIPDPPTFVGITCTSYDGTTPWYVFPGHCLLFDWFTNRPTSDGFIFGCNDVYAGGQIVVGCGGLPN